METESFLCLSVRQPWADLIVSGIKDVENRSWPTNVRGPVLIHAPRTVDMPAVSRVLRWLQLRSPADYQPVLGAIVGITHIVDCVRQHPSRFFSGPFGFVLENSRRFTKPIPLAGRLGFFAVPRSLLSSYISELDAATGASGGKTP